jgi:hypothetical protein
LIADFAQNRSTIDFLALFCTVNVTVASFYTPSATTGH